MIERKAALIAVFSIRELEFADAALFADIIRRSFADVAQRFGLTQENCPGNGAFLQDKALQKAIQRDERFFGLYAAGVAVGCAGLKAASICNLVFFLIKIIMDIERTS